MINIGADGRPLRPACLWLDQRKADSTGIIPSITRPVLKAIRLSDRIEGAVQNCEANWIRQNQPDIWNKTHKYLLLSVFFTYMLTGEFADSVANNVGYLPIDNKTYQWAENSTSSGGSSDRERKAPAACQAIRSAGKHYRTRCGRNRDT